MFPLVGVFMVGLAGGVGAKIGTDVVYPWVKDKVEKAWEVCKCADCNCIVCECSKEDIDFNKKSSKKK